MVGGGQGGLGRPSVARQTGKCNLQGARFLLYRLEEPVMRSLLAEILATA